VPRNFGAVFNDSLAAGELAFFFAKSRVHVLHNALYILSLDKATGSGKAFTRWDMTASGLSGYRETPVCLYVLDDLVMAAM